MPEKTLTISNKRGLHARAATKLASTAAQYTSEIKVSCKTQTVDAKSIMSLMLLAAAKGTDITLTINGSDQSEAMEALADLVNNKFDEGE